MSAFAIFLHHDQTESNKRLRKLIEEAYPESAHYKFSDFVYLVTGPRVVSEVAETLKLDDEEDLYAAILRLNGSFTGRSWTAMWDWLRATEIAA